MFAQATMNGSFELPEMPNLFCFWSKRKVERPIRPEPVTPTIWVGNFSFAEGTEAVVYPLLKAPSAARKEDQQYAIVRFSGNKLNFNEATYFKNEGIAVAVTSTDGTKEMQPFHASRFDTCQPLTSEDKNWLQETLEKQKQKKIRKREPKI